MSASLADATTGSKETDLYGLTGLLARARALAPKLRERSHGRKAFRNFSSVAPGLAWISLTKKALVLLSIYFPFSPIDPPLIGLFLIGSP